MKEELGKWLDQGIIRKSSSPWASPMVIVHNKDETIRLTVDFRKVNPYIETDNYPMPLRDAVIEKLHTSKFISKLDLTKAYLQIPLNEESKKFTSFVVESGQYEFNMVPFGIKFASGLCNRLIRHILSECDSFVASFVDDLVVYSNSYEEHLEHLDLVLTKLRESGITLNRKKCSFGNSEVKFLGVVVGNGKVLPDPEKVSALKNFPRPVDKKALRSYLGLLSFYRKFIPHLASHTKPLTDLLKKDNPDKIKWNDDLIKTFDNSRLLMCQEIELSIPKPDERLSFKLMLPVMA